MQFSKKFSGLRPDVEKHRKSGYYWVKWTYATDSIYVDGWRIGYYQHASGVWSLIGELRFYKDSDFIQIDENGFTERLKWGLHKHVKSIFILIWCLWAIFNIVYLLKLLLQ